MRLEACEEIKRIIALFGKTHFSELTYQEWDAIFEHEKKCERCRQNNSLFDKYLQSLSTPAAKKYIRKHGIGDYYWQFLIEGKVEKP